MRFHSRVTEVFALLLLAFSLPVRAQSPSPAEIARWEQQAQRVEIIRDRWGIAHVYGKTDADAVFGMEYAQAEDDFARIERNYLVQLGRLAEAEGESALWQDLRARLYADPDSLKAAYARAPASLQVLMDAFADGLNYFLYKHPEVKPRALARFEPWMALSFTEGSIGGDIERINLGQLAEFYGAPARVGGAGDAAATTSPAGLPALEPGGSNGIAIAPKLAVNGHALLWINPHTSFYFRSELQMASEAGLNAYGAVTWGQFFIYQGFNERAGWMHTSSGVDNIDWFRETVVQKGGRWYYRHAGRDVRLATRPVTIRYRNAEGGLAARTFTAYFTRHGPVVARQGERWLSVSMMWDPADALTQSYTRTKATTLAEYLQIMELHTNSSNNTLYANAAGDIAYLHSNYIPRRDPSLDWSEPVDGSDARTDYRGVHAVSETPNVINPRIGWVYNVNNWPWSAAGPETPKREQYPAYVDEGRWETPRGVHALRLLSEPKQYTIESLTELSHDSWLPAFAGMVPRLVQAYDALPAARPERASLAAPIAVLRAWDYRYGVSSVATSLAVFWGEDVLRRIGRASRPAGVGPEDHVASGAVPGDTLLAALASAVQRLENDFGTWQTPWGEINRFQRISPDIAGVFDDAKPSIPVGFTASTWGSLAAFGARPGPNTRRWYGQRGNSFVAAVEFGDSVRARAVSAGGESGDPASPHFNDQAPLYAQGFLRDVYFYRADVERHAERKYRPGA